MMFVSMELSYIKCSMLNTDLSLSLSGSEVKPSHSNMSTPPHPQPPAKGASHGAGDFSYVGIDAILEQMRRKAMKQGFELNIMIVGECC